MDLEKNISSTDPTTVRSVCCIVVRISITGKVSLPRILSWMSLFRPGGLLYRGDSPSPAQIVELHHDELANFQPGTTIHSEEEWRTILSRNKLNVEFLVERSQYADKHHWDVIALLTATRNLAERSFKAKEEEEEEKQVVKDWVQHGLWCSGNWSLARKLVLLDDGDEDEGESDEDNLMSSEAGLPVDYA